MTESGKEILDRVKKMKTLNIAGNSGGFAVLEYKNGTFQFVTGFGAVEESRREISPNEALQIVKNKILQKGVFFDEITISSNSDEDVLNYWIQEKPLG